MPRRSPTKSRSAEGRFLRRWLVLGVAFWACAVPAQAGAQDMTPPDTAILAGPGNGFFSTNVVTPTFTFTSTEPDSIFSCQVVSPGPFYPCNDDNYNSAGKTNGSWTSDPLPEGQHTLTVIATDQAGNSDLTAATRSFTIDLTAPDTTIDTGPPPGSTSNDPSPLFTFHANESPAVLQCKLERVGGPAPGPFEACNFDSQLEFKQYANLADGQYIFRVMAIDKAGNQDPTPASRTFSVSQDSPPPGPDPDPGQTTPDLGPGTVTPAPAPTITPPTVSPQAGEVTRLSAEVAPAFEAEKFLWDFTGDGEPEARCDASTSGIETSFNTSGVRTVALTARSASGETATSNLEFEVSRAARNVQRFLDATQNNKFLDASVYACVRGNLDAIIDLTANGGPSGACTREGAATRTVEYGLIAAEGCFEVVDQLSDLPQAERDQYLHSTSILVELLTAWKKPFSPCLGKTLESHARSGAVREERRASLLVNPAAIGCVLNTYVHPYISYRTVRINGVDYTPQRGSAIVLLPGEDLVIGSDVKVTLGNVGGVTLPLDSGQLDARVGADSGNTSGRVGVAFYDLSTQAKKIGLGGLPFEGWLEAEHVHRETEVTVNVVLPDFFSYRDGRRPTVKVAMRTDNAGGVRLNAIDAYIPEIQVAGLQATELRLQYQHPGNWAAGGAIYLMDLKPPSPGLDFRLDHGYGVRFVNSAFKSAGGKLDLGSAASIPIGPGVHIRSFSFAMQLNPTVLAGGIGIEAAKLALVDGKMVTAFATPQKPYTLSAAAAGPELVGLVGRRFTSTTIAAGGSASLILPDPVGTVGPVGSGYLVYSFPSYVGVGGRVQIGLFVVRISGSVTGEANASNNRFNFGINGVVEVPGLAFGGDAVLSSRGVAACASLRVKVYNPASIVGVGPEYFEVQVSDGFGYGPWGSGFSGLTIWLLGGCDAGPYREPNVQSSGADVTASQAEDGVREFHVDKGMNAVNVRLMGAAGAPDVTVTAPDGETLVRPAEPGVSGNPDGHLMMLWEPEINQTVIAVRDPLPGTYRVAPNPGSAPIDSLETSVPLAPASVKGSVSGTGFNRTLTYDVRGRDGQTVEFFEEGPQISQSLGSVKGGQGEIDFAPADGAEGPRTIVARVSIDGVVREELKLTAFASPGPIVPSRARITGVTRRGENVIVRFQPPARSDHSVVTFRTTSGRTGSTQVPAGKRRAVLSGIPAVTPGVVEVGGVSALNVSGPLAKRSFKATQRRPVWVKGA